MSRVNEQFLPVLIDADEQPAVTGQLQAESLPTILVISPERRVLSRATGFQSVAELEAMLAKFQTSVPRKIAATSSRSSFHRWATETYQTEKSHHSIDAATAARNYGL